MPFAVETSRLKRSLVVPALGLAQILGWGTSFYFPAVFSGPMIAETGWPLSYIVSGASIGLLIGGLVSPSVGRLIARYGGRPLLLSSSVMFAAGLVGIALSSSPAMYLACWTIIGLGMGAGLYDAAFATLGQMYGREARSAITNLTLIGGLASTVCWPLSALLIDFAGWRSACLIYAALHIALSMPLQAFAVSRMPVAIDEADHGASEANVAGTSVRNQLFVLILLGLVMSIAAGVGAVLVVNLLIFLQARGLDFASAVALGSLFGPSQVVARLTERLFGSNYHPIWTLIAACVLMALGLVALHAGAPGLLVAIVVFGSGFGISWVARGTVPLALFGAARFPLIVGRLALPSLMALAIAPTAGAWLIESIGTDSTIGLLTGLALANVVLVGLLWIVCRRSLNSGT